MKIFNILEGWKKLLSGEAPDDTVRRRGFICGNCIYNRLGVCSKCFCPIEAKIRASAEKCPEGKW